MKSKIGQTIGGALVLGVAKRTPRATRPGQFRLHYRLQCQCGAQFVSPENALQHKRPLLCAACKPKAPPSPYTHPLYKLWESMHRRCTSPADIGYALYGGRGIAVCQEWTGAPTLGAKKSITGFLRFVQDVGDRPSAKHSLDRIDSDKGYCPKNVQWALPEEQARNRRTTIFVTLPGGESLPFTHALRKLGANRRKAFALLRRHGWTHQQCVDRYVALGYPRQAGFLLHCSP